MLWDTYRSRFSDAPWLLKENLPIITVGGAGGIGSWLLLFLSRTRNYSKVYVYEHDIIEETNIAGQFFSPDQIGLSKGLAVARNIKEFSDYTNITTFGKFEEDSFVSPITFSCFDNMLARKFMFEKWKSLENRELYIDGRMLFEDGQVYTVTKENQDKYEATLFDDKDLPNVACSMKATTHCGAHIASVMLASLNNYLANTYFYKDYIREVPFKYEFSLTHLFFNIDV